MYIDTPRINLKVRELSGAGFRVREPARAVAPATGPVWQFCADTCRSEPNLSNWFLIRSRRARLVASIRILGPSSGRHDLARFLAAAADGQNTDDSGCDSRVDTSARRTGIAPGG